jgi:tetratricopeptide (TPR) repeat protein
MRRFLTVLALGAVLYLGYQWWNARQSDTAAKPVPVAPAKPTPAVRPSQNPQLPTGEPPPRISVQVEMVNPGVLTEGTPHATLLNGIRQMLEQGNVAEAEARLMTLPKDASGDPAARRFIADLWNNLGVTRAATGGMAAGVKAFKNAVSLDPEGARAHVNLTNALWELKEPGLSRELLEATVALAPDEPLPHLLLADILYANKDLKGAVAQLDLAAEHLGQNPKLRSFVQSNSARIKLIINPPQQHGD